MEESEPSNCNQPIPVLVNATQCGSVIINVKFVNELFDARLIRKAQKKIDNIRKESS